MEVNSSYTASQLIGLLEEKIECFDRIDVTLRANHKRIASAKRDLILAKASIANDMDRTQSATYDFALSAIANCEEVTASLSRIPTSIYAQLSSVSFYEGDKKVIDAVREKYEKVGLALYGIEAIATTPEQLIIKLPMLPSVNDIYLQQGGKKFCKTYSTIYAEDVNRAVIFCLHSSCVPIKNFLAKTLNFYFVYSPSERKRIDTMNHDTKAIIDAITSPLGGDSASICDCFFFTRTSEDLPSGTYVVLNSGLEMIEPLGTIEENHHRFCVPDFPALTPQDP